MNKLKCSNSSSGFKFENEWNRSNSIVFKSEKKTCPKFAWRAIEHHSKQHHQIWAVAYFTKNNMTTSKLLLTYKSFWANQSSKGMQWIRNNSFHVLVLGVLSIVFISFVKTFTLNTLSHKNVYQHCVATHLILGFHLTLTMPLLGRWRDKLIKIQKVNCN